MTIHRRRGSGYAHYWAFIVFGAVGLVAAVVLASSHQLGVNWVRVGMAVAGGVAALAVTWVLTRRRG